MPRGRPARSQPASGDRHPRAEFSRPICRPADRLAGAGIKN
jgi:hypothetical protein